jgi:hypothetical protein
MTIDEIVAEPAARSTPKVEKLTATRVALQMIPALGPLVCLYDGIRDKPTIVDNHYWSSLFYHAAGLTATLIYLFPKEQTMDYIMK